MKDISKKNRHVGGGHAIWSSLRNHSISDDEFEIARGTKQGDPLSHPLSAMEKDICTWTDKGLGIKFGDEKRDCAFNLRCGDDVLMMATSLTQLKRMMTDFKQSTDAQRLEFHPDKT